MTVLDADEPLSKAMEKIIRSGTAVVVVKNGRYYGVLDDRNLSAGIQDPSAVKCGTACQKAPSLRSSSSLYERLQAFLTGHFKALPVVNEKNVPVAMCSRLDLLEELLRSSAIPSLPVSMLASGPVHSIETSASVSEAVGSMRKLNIHHLLAIEKGRPYGIISTFDMVAFALEPKSRRGKAVVQSIRSLKMKRISDVLRPGLAIVDGATDLPEAARKMTVERHSTLLVQNNGQYVGFLTATDIFKYLLRRAEESFPIAVDGLGEEDRFALPEIQRALEAVAKKYSKSFKLDSVRVHFKKGTSVYSAYLSLRVNDKPLTVTAEEYDIKTVVRRLADELRITLHKKKDARQFRRRRT